MKEQETSMEKPGEKGRERKKNEEKKIALRGFDPRTEELLVMSFWEMLIGVDVLSGLWALFFVSGNSLIKADYVITGAFPLRHNAAGWKV